MPTLTGKYQHKVLESQFKKSYANLQTAINTLNSQNGIPYECYTLTNGSSGYRFDQCNEFWPKLLEQYKTAKFCINTNSSCRPRYKTKAEVLAEGGTIKNSSCSHPINGSEAYNLNDGSIIYIYKGSDSGYNNHTSLYFGLDVNGKKGPNKWGYDLFYLNLYKRNEKSPVLGLTAICELIEKGGQSAESMMLK